MGDEQLAPFKILVKLKHSLGQAISHRIPYTALSNLVHLGELTIPYFADKVFDTNSSDPKESSKTRRSSDSSANAIMRSNP